MAGAPPQATTNPRLIIVPGARRVRGLDGRKRKVEGVFAVYGLGCARPATIGPWLHDVTSAGPAGGSPPRSMGERSSSPRSLPGTDDPPSTVVLAADRHRRRRRAGHLRGRAPRARATAPRRRPPRPRCGRGCRPRRPRRSGPPARRGSPPPCRFRCWTAPTFDPGSSGSPLLLGRGLSRIGSAFQSRR